MYLLPIHPLFAKPAYPREFLILKTTEGHRVLKGKTQNSYFGWHPGSLFDSQADTALHAFVLSADYLQKDSYQQTTLISVQIQHYAANLAAKLHALAPFESRAMICHHAINTVLRMSQLADKPCMQMLVDAGLVNPVPYLGHTQMLIRTAHRVMGCVPQALIGLLSPNAGIESYADRVVDVFFDHPDLIEHIEQLDHCVLFQLKSRLCDDSKSTDAKQQLSQWLDQQSDSCTSKTNFEALNFEALSPTEVLESFTVLLTEMSYSDDERAPLKTRVHRHVLSQSGLASRLLAGDITSGRYEIVDGEALPVFRASRTVTCRLSDRKSLSSVTLVRINGGALTPESIKLFCDLFCLEFNFAASPIAIDAHI